MDLEEKDLIELKYTIKSPRGVPIGDGTRGVVMIPPNADDTFIAEFLDADGNTIDICDVSIPQVRLIYKYRLGILV